MNGRYTFADYSPRWPLAFEEEAARLTGLLGDTLVVVHHIGSTAVPGLAAKPIIDLLPVAVDVSEIDRRAPLLVSAGYRAWGECGLAGRRYFTKDHNGLRTRNLHLYAAGDLEIERHLAFRDYLRAHPSACREYEVIKRAAFHNHPANIDAYNDAKNACIKRLEAVALRWIRSREPIQRDPNPGDDS